MKEIIDNFSFSGKRELDIVIDKRVILAKSRYQGNSIADNRKSILLLGGEFYGESICKGDCAEFMLKSYEEQGADFLKKARGIFAFALYNKENNKLTLGNDSFGLHPLFTYDCEEYVIFCSEYEPITKYRKFDKELDYSAIAEYFVLGLPLGCKTFFKNIKNLCPGSLLSVRNNKTSLKQYEKLDIKVDKNKSINQFAKEISKAFKKAVQIRVKNRKNLASHLTSGADTRLILSSLTKNQRKSIKFFTDKSPNLKECEDVDTATAKEIAKKLRLNYKVSKKLTNKTDDINAFGASFFERVRIVPEPNEQKLLAGTFGGEFLGGLCLRLCPIKIKEVKKSESKQEIRTASQRIEKRSKGIFSAKIIGKVSNPYSSLKKELKSIKAENKRLLFAIHQFTRGFFTNINGGTRSGRWFSPHIMHLSSRFLYPFLDSDFLKLLLSVPEEFLIDYNLYNQIYKNFSKELNKIPTNSLLALRKDSCMKFTKKGKDPKAARIYSSYSKVLKEYLNSKDTWAKGFFNPEQVKVQSKITARNHSPYDTQTKFISSFIDFETWYRKFVGKK